MSREESKQGQDRLPQTVLHFKACKKLPKQMSRAGDVAWELLTIWDYPCLFSSTLMMSTTEN